MARTAKTEEQVVVGIGGGHNGRARTGVPEDVALQRGQPVRIDMLDNFYQHHGVKVLHSSSRYIAEDCRREIRGPLTVR
jgi:hypothetical protein